eukprot:753772_1
MQCQSHSILNRSYTEDNLKTYHEQIEIAQMYVGIQLMNDAHHYELYHLNDDATGDCDIAEKEEYDAYVCCKVLLQKARDEKFVANESDLFHVYAKQIHGKEFNIIEIASNLHQMI